MIPQKKKIAFALVEVVLALGIGCFAFTAMIGLLSATLSFSKASLDDTLVSAMANSIVSDLQALCFADNSPKNPPTDLTPLHAGTDANVLPGTTDVPAGSVPAQVTPSPQIYFDASGTRLKYKSRSQAGQDMTKADAISSGAVYECTEVLQGDHETLGVTGSDGSAATQEVNMLNVTLTFVWPVQAKNPPNRSVVHARIARY